MNEVTKSLTLEDRYRLSMYSRKLPCTLRLRLVINDFLSQIEITSDEMKKFEVSIDPTTMAFNCNDSEYTVDYTGFPQDIIIAMTRYVSLLDTEKNADNVLLQKTLLTFKKII